MAAFDSLKYTIISLNVGTRHFFLYKDIFSRRGWILLFFCRLWGNYQSGTRWTIITWLYVNKLSLNIDKTHFVIFHPYQKKLNYSMKIEIDSKTFGVLCKIRHYVNVKILVQVYHAIIPFLFFSYCCIV